MAANKGVISKNASSDESQTMLSYGVKPYQATLDEEYMNDTQKKHFEHILMTWRNALLQGGDVAIEDLQNASNENPSDISDQASMEEEFALKLRKRDRERKLISKIESSLQLLKNDEYGYCEECGIDIGIRRLEARPTATLCIDCKTIAEIKEKQQQR
jgi:DnaK suppressor protein